MPETVTKYKVFIASPSDLKEDRQSIDEVISELNMTYGSQNNLIIEVLKWETHSAPGISQNHVQDIINKDIGDDYDIFIGLMWLKFGSATNVAGSGTEEEFINAYKRFQEDLNSIQILFYFKDSLPQSLQDINPEELKRINEFKAQIGKENVLYWNYKSIDELHGFLRLHIPKRITNIKSLNKSETNNSVTVEIAEVIESEDLGLLDYIDISESRFEDATLAVNNIAKATEWIGDKITEKSEEIYRLTSIGNQVNQMNLRKVFKLTAQLMNEYAARINVENPIFFENYQEGIKALSAIVNISDDFFDKENIDDLLDSKESIIEMNRGITIGLNGMISFYESVIGLPRIEKEINKAKRNVASKLDSLINDLRMSSQLAVELIKEISEKVDRIKITFSNK